MGIDAKHETILRKLSVLGRKPYLSDFFLQYLADVQIRPDEVPLCRAGAKVPIGTRRAWTRSRRYSPRMDKVPSVPSVRMS